MLLLCCSQVELSDWTANGMEMEELPEKDKQVEETEVDKMIGMETGDVIEGAIQLAAQPAAEVFAADPTTEASDVQADTVPAPIARSSPKSLDETDKPMVRVAWCIAVGVLFLWPFVFHMLFLLFFRTLLTI